VLRVRPSVKEKSINFGKISTAPSHEGILVKYISEIVDDDTTYAPTFLRTYLSKILGENIEQSGKVLQTYYSHWGWIGKTEAGKQMSNVLFSLHIALQSETQCYPLFSMEEKLYEGCLVLGKDFQVDLDDVVYKSVDLSKLNIAQRGFDTHTTSILRILEIVGEPDCRKVDTSTMRTLSNTLLKTKLTENQREQIVSVSKHLTFDIPFWPTSNDRVIDCINHIIEGKELKREDPMHHSAILSSDIIMRTLAVFGQKAPHLNIRNGKVLQIEGTWDNAKPFYYEIINLKPAVESWNKTKEDKAISNQSCSQGAADSLKKFAGNETKAEVWSLLKKMVKNDEKDKKEEGKPDVMSSSAVASSLY